MKFTKASGWMGLAATVAAGMLSGCGLGTVASPTSTYGSGGAIAGSVFGGQQPVQFAAVKLYSAGTTDYGSASTLLATSAPTDASGTFHFTKSSTNGPSDGSAGPNWACPANTTGEDPIIYLMSTGGNSTGNGLNDTADTNSAITLLAVLGPCSTISTNTTVNVDEYSTAATVYALSAYINPGTTAGTATIGTKGTNIPTGATQAAIGFKNAIANIANLKTTSSVTYTNTSVSSVAGVTVTATPEPGKVAAIADILASCVNTQTLPSNNCTQLFNAALSTANTKPSDILQAAYNMATNPSNLGTFTACGGPTTNTACLYALISPYSPFPVDTAPFANSLASAPTDWTVGVTYTATGTGCSNNGFGGAKFFDTPTRAAVDANGNIFIMNGSTSKAAIVEMSPYGQPLACVIPAAATGTAQTYGNNLSIDPSGNVWGTYSHTTFTNAVVEWPAGATLPVTYSPVAEPYALTTDRDGNVFYTTSASGGTVYEFVAPTSGTLGLSGATPVTAFTSFWASQTGVNQVNNMQTDTLGRIFGITPSTSNLLSAYPLTGTITGYSVSSNAVTFTGANTFSVGQTVTISGLTSANGQQFNGKRLVVTAQNASSFTGSFTTTDVASTTDSGTARATGAGAYTTVNTGLTSASYGLAIGAGNSVFTGTACCGNTSTAIGDAERFTPASTAVAGAGAHSAQYLGGLTGTRAVAVDGAGTVWMGEYWPATGSTYGLVALTSAGTGTSATFTALSPNGTAPTTACSNTAGCPSNGGFQKASFQATMDVVTDPSGNVWVLNTGTNTSGTIGTNGVSVTEVVGAAAPTVTPLSLAAANGTIATKP